MRMTNGIKFGSGDKVRAVVIVGMGLLVAQGAPPKCWLPAMALATN